MSNEELIKSLERREELKAALKRIEDEIDGLDLAIKAHMKEKGFILEDPAFKQHRTIGR